MRIIGPDEMVFGVDNVEASKQFLLDYGLKQVSDDFFEALDGTGIRVMARDDESLPAALETGATIRQTVYGVEDTATIDAIEAEMKTDREVLRDAAGAITFVDDLGMALKFQVTARRTLDLPPELVNSPGAKPGRAMNQLGASQDAPALPRTLSHIVYFTPDVDKHETFYRERLGFILTDRFTGVGPFLRPQACQDHHTLFMLQTPPFMQGLEHLAFHMQGPTELMLAGSRLVQKGWESFWGPGRHKFGSNWFWYFNCPLMVHFEYDADMDIHDDNWTPRETEVSPEASQVFLFENVEKWSPGDNPPPNTNDGMTNKEDN
ncbi:MAG: VOC family protein [Maritimibacter sp.]